MQEFKIAKTDDEQHVVFGWASVSKNAEGNLLADWQGDIIEPEELEKAAFDFVLNFRDTGEEHDPNLRKKGKLVSSIVFTEDIQKALNIPKGAMPVGWFVGFKIRDAQTWDEIKKGHYKMFSIEGKGQRVPFTLTDGAVTFAELQKFNPYHGRDGSWMKSVRIDNSKNVAKTFSEVRVEKYNPYHDRKGRFTSRGNMNYFSPGRDPLQAKRSIAREKEKSKNDGFYDPNKSSDEHLDWWRGENRSDPVVPQKRGVASVKWSGLSGSEFKQAIDDYMPGALDIAKKVSDKYGTYAGHTINSRLGNTGGWINTKDGGDRGLLAIYKSRGYDAKPQIMNRKDIRKYINNNPKSPHLYRGAGKSSSGQSGKDKMDHFINDNFHYAGLGVYGNGTYAAESPKTGRYAGVNSGYRTARAYARGEKDAIIRCTLDSKAKTGNFNTIRKNKMEFLSELQRHYHQGDISGSDYDYLFNLAKDTGRFAALRGFDAYKTTNSRHGGASQQTPFWIILNRGSMIIQDERVK